MAFGMSYAQYYVSVVVFWFLLFLVMDLRGLKQINK